MFVNRIFKFRGQDISGVWHFGDLIHYRNCVTISEYKNGLWGNHEVISNTAGQFTGLYDIDGKEIFEGDILQHAKIPAGKLLVFWDDRVCAFAVKEPIQHLTKTTVSNYRIIGNIHDNYDLLKEGFYNV